MECLFNSKLLFADSSSAGGTPTIDALETVGIFFGFIALLILIIVAKKILYRLKYKKRLYIFPRIGTKGIANIAMVISISVVALLLLTVLTAGILGVVFRAYPGWRVTVEGILIKIGGLLFGPIIGMFIGAITDLLAIALTAGMFHYGFFIVAISYGLLSGIVRSIYNMCKNKQTEFVFISTILIGLIMVASIIFTMTQMHIYDVALFGISVNVPNWAIALEIGGVYAIGLVLMWILMFVYNKNQIICWSLRIKNFFKFKSKIGNFKYSLKREYDKQSIADKELEWCSKNIENISKMKFEIDQKQSLIQLKKNNWLTDFIPVLVCVLFGEIIIHAFLIPTFDHSMTGQPYSFWFAIRVVTIVAIVPLNILVIYPVYHIVSLNIQYNYQDDIIENANIPLMND